MFTHTDTESQTIILSNGRVYKIKQAKHMFLMSAQITDEGVSVKCPVGCHICVLWREKAVTTTPAARLVVTYESNFNRVELARSTRC